MNHLASNHLPTSQKQLFHKDINVHVRKWITSLDVEDIRKVLLLCGPIGCGKTTLVNVMFKGFNLHHIDAMELRSVERATELASYVPGYADLTLANIDKWNQKSNKEKPNVCVIENIENCDKFIESFVELLHKKRAVQVPLILTTSANRMKDAFSKLENCLVLNMQAPSLLELTKLATEINVKEKLALQKNQILKIIDRAMGDARQLLYILEQWKYDSSSFDKFIESVSKKNKDVDLVDKLTSCFHGEYPFETNEFFNMSFSEPAAVASGLFQNTPGMMELLCKDPDTVDCMSGIADDFSIANLVNVSIFSKQLWELYDFYTMIGCVSVTQRFKDLEQIQQVPPHRVTNAVLPFKDMSYNFINSWESVWKSTLENWDIQRYQKGLSGVTLPRDSDSCWSLAQVCLLQIDMVSASFEANKKGKNTTKKEKITLVENMDEVVKRAFDSLLENVYMYRLFEVDMDDILLGSEDMDLQENLKKVDIRMFKRFLNIFSLGDISKRLKSHVETALRYKLLQRLIQDTSDFRHNTVANTRSIDNLTQDLSTIWNLD